MGDGPRYNLRSPSVKRLMQESKELREATEQYHAQPLEDNLYEWHFTIRGAPDTDFADGVYHGRIMLPPEYPMKPPSIVLLTPNGRFEINKKICLSISGHHPESWQPSWSIRTALMAIIGFMPSPGKGAIGALDYPPEERKKLARRSKEWKCPVCGQENHRLLKAPADETSNESQEILEEVKNLARKISFKGESSSVSPVGESGDGAKSKSTSEADDGETSLSPVDASGAVSGAASDSADTLPEENATASTPTSTKAPESAQRESSQTPPPSERTPAFPLDDSPSPSDSSTASAAVTASAAAAGPEETADNELRRRVGRLEDVAEREVAAREATIAASREITPTPVRTTPATPATVRNQAYSTTSSYLMILLSIAIGVLLLRRILRLVDFQFDFEFDYKINKH